MATYPAVWVVRSDEEVYDAGDEDLFGVMDADAADDLTRLRRLALRVKDGYDRPTRHAIQIYPPPEPQPGG